MTIHRAIIHSSLQIYTAPNNSDLRPLMALPISRLVTNAARIWRWARDLGLPVQVQLYGMLAPRNWEMLAPTLDSYITLTEWALQRPIKTAHDQNYSSDEIMLIAMLNGTMPLNTRIQGAEYVLDCTLQSTRLMLAKVTGHAARI